MTTCRRLHVPAENGVILADPNLEEAGSLLVENQSVLDGWQYDFQGRRADRLRAMTRAAVLKLAATYTRTDFDERSAPSNPQSTVEPLQPSRTGPPPATPPSQPVLLTGHQPELFHPGVWVKNFVASALARKHGAVAVHLIVDNDTVKKTTVRLPTGSAERPTVVHIPLDRWRGEIPYEEHVVSDEALFASFGGRAVAALEPLGVRPMAVEFWPMAVEAGRKTAQLSERIASARRQIEADWGGQTLELAVSQLCQTEGFLWFTGHVLAQLADFHAAYNGALAEHRRRHRIRSRNHPVPSLGRDGQWLEAPFWVWSVRSPRRRRLFASRVGRDTVLTDRDQWTLSLPLGPDRDACCAVEVLAQLPRQGIKIRTRALTTTIFTRLCVGDLFIHGLGGARYDELSDEILRRFFGIEPPRFLMITGTLRLPVAVRPGARQERRDLQRLLRGLTYNPDRHLPVSTDREVARLVEAKRQAVTSEPESAVERRRRFDEIRRINRMLQPFVEDTRSETAARMEQSIAREAAGAILQSRDWAFCAYPSELLRGFFRPFLAH